MRCDQKLATKREGKCCVSLTRPGQSEGFLDSYSKVSNLAYTLAFSSSVRVSKPGTVTMLFEGEVLA